MSALQNFPSLEQAWEQLNCIPPDCPRNEWVNIAMALQSEFGADGFSLFDDWSSSGLTYNPKDSKALWRSIKSGAIGIGTLFHYAKVYGYQSNARSLPSIKPAPKPEPRNFSSYAKEIWLMGEWDNRVVASHPYCIKKGIEWAGGAKRGIASGSKVGKNADCIIVPIRKHGDGEVMAVECINAEGEKQTFGSKSEGYLLLGNTLDKSITWYVCEGWASAYSTVFHHQNGNGVCACSFGKGSLDTVANLINEFHQPDDILIVREKD